MGSRSSIQLAKVFGKPCSVHAGGCGLLLVRQIDLFMRFKWCRWWMMVVGIKRLSLDAKVGLFIIGIVSVQKRQTFNSKQPPRKQVFTRKMSLPRLPKKAVLPRSPFPMNVSGTHLIPTVPADKAQEYAGSMSDSPRICKGRENPRWVNCVMLIEEIAPVDVEAHRSSFGAGRGIGKNITSTPYNKSNLS